MGPLFFYQNPKLLFILIVGICSTGIASFLMLPRMEDPPLKMRVGVVRIVYPGASAEELEIKAARPIEEALVSLDGIDTFRTNCRTGFCNIVIQLSDKVSSVDDVWGQIRDAIRPLDFPDGCQRPKVKVFPLKAYTAILSLNSDSADLNRSRKAALHLKSELQMIGDVEEVFIFGDPGLQVQIKVQPEKLTEYGLSFGQLASEIDSVLTSSAIGDLESNQSKIQVNMAGNDVSVLKDRKIRTRTGQEVSVGELAEIGIGQELNPIQKVRVDGTNAVVLGVRVKDGINIQTWSNKLDEQLGKTRKEFPQIEINEVFSQNKHIEERMSRLTRSLALSGVVVVIVVLLLMGWKSMIVVTATLPLTIMSVAVCMYFMQIPIHQISVTGIIVSLGLLIDNAIVVVDDVKKRLSDGQPAAAAIKASIGHLRYPLLGATVTTALSFLPIAMLPGSAGEFVGSMAITVIAAVVASYCVATLILPSLAGLIIRQSNVLSVAENGLENRSLSDAYFRLLKTCFQKPVLIVAIGILVPSCGFLVWKNLPVQFFPAADRQQIQIEVERVASSTMEQLESTVVGIELYLNENQSIAKQNWFLGSSAPMFYYNVVPRYERAPHYAQSFLNLEGVSDANDQKALVEKLQTDLSERFPDARVTVRRLEQGPPFDAPVEIIVSGPDVDQLLSIGQMFRKILDDIPDVIQTDSDLDASSVVTDFVPNRLACEELGISPDSIQQELSAAVNGLRVGKVFIEDELLDVNVQLELNSSDQEELLLDLPIHRRFNSGANRNTPSIRMLGDFTFHTKRNSIMKRNGQYVDVIKGYIKTNALPADVISSFRQRLIESNFRVPDGYRMNFAGEEEKRTSAESSLFASVPLFGCLILFLMVAIFGSFRSSFCIALVGALTLGLVPLTLLAFSMPFGFMALIGAMGLIGIAINDSIVVLAGLHRLEAGKRQCVESVAKVVYENTRHILTTTLTTVAGFLPLVVYGGEFWPPMAISICIGILGATLLAIFFVPSLDLVLNGGGKSHENSAKQASENEEL